MMRIILDFLELLLILATIFTGVILLPLVLFRLLGILLGAA